MNKEINENEKEKRQPVYRQEAMQRAMKPQIDFSSASKGIEKAGNSLASGVEKTIQHMKQHMDSFDM